MVLQPPRSGIVFGLMFGVIFIYSMAKAFSAEAAGRMVWAAVATVSGVFVLLFAVVIAANACRGLQRASAVTTSDDEGQD